MLIGARILRIEIVLDYFKLVKIISGRVNVNWASIEANFIGTVLNFFGIF